MLCGLAAALAGVATAETAAANGVFPAASQLVSAPSDPSQLLLRTTFGLLVSSDSGQSFAWTCEDALGYANTLPSLTLLRDGAVLLGVPDGVRVGTLAGCGFALSAGASTNIVDLSRVASRPASVLALGVDYALRASWVYESSDAGASFTAISEAIPEFIATTIDVAASDADVIYVSGMPAKSGSQGLLLRSSDHGQTFTSNAVPDSDGAAWPYIGAIDPVDANTVYVRLSAVPGHLKVTHDGGRNFQEPLLLDYELLGFALSPDGKTAIASSPASGTFRIDAQSLEVEQVACQGVSCLLWNDAGLFACGEPSRNGFVVGRSLDEGRSYERLLDFGCIKERTDCEATTPVGSLCAAAWPAVAAQLEGFGACDPQAAPSPIVAPCPTGDGGDATAGSTTGGGAGRVGSSTLGGAAGASGVAPHGAGGGNTSGGAPAASGCACQSSRRPPSNRWLAVAALGVWLAQRATRKRRAARRASLPSQTGTRDRAWAQT